MILPNNKAFVVLLAFFSYYVSAKIGLLFAIPPGFASTIWPAAGIGLAIYLISGRWALLGIFLASTFANYQVSNGVGNPFVPEMLILPALLAIGTTLQLIVSKLLLTKFLETPIKAFSLVSVIRFLLIVGPLSCLVAASLNSTSIALIKDLSTINTLFVAFTWWVGDFLGVIFFTPVLLSIFENNYYQQKKDRLRIALPAFVLFLLVSFVFYLSRINYEESRNDQFESETASFSQTLNILENTNILATLRKLVRFMWLINNLYFIIFS